MHLYELVNDPKLIKLIAATDQLRLGLESNEISDNWPIEALQAYFRRFDLTFSNDDLYKMIQTKPLKNIITNIEGDQVIFKGVPQKEKQPESPPPDQSKDIVSKMAKKALKK